ncbi:hypothetical protein MPTK1_8g00820 [Marchantia polymorpha subsp. ruderalis]|uniref:Uncharacterized protein n=1 Tax=Marchantia polymorpha TaxID=3197 RepID=A0A2R6WRK6_MARPO|nr:hypothetical protein MARPO_0064s0115 [Marchantia polymorpha]BBN18229.1 hypothetical protein Mp_8g00820 [Marchantia polymorpha subsp. ruderalis]|eukprot:PTQ36443.1 hypothetical protein MARPO_0064s0115 [Marchantia polymorpha]
MRNLFACREGTRLIVGCKDRAIILRADDLIDECCHTLSTFGFPSWSKELHSDLFINDDVLLIDPSMMKRHVLSFTRSSLAVKSQNLTLL